MKRELENYVVLLAISLLLQSLAYFWQPESLEYIFLHADEFIEEGGFFKYVLQQFLAITFILLPGIFTAIWVLRIRSVSITRKWAWVLVSLFTEYFILLFYFAYQYYETGINNEKKA
ncbi:hypothetical protein TDB9533_04416 [Thalassocella blandensis]|nr:hypothetical protein TDB9533_04416 [Thalassocella blandensis]